MQYIKKIEIKNFQSHNNTKLEFSKGVNVITGESDRGKSAIIRAIRWVLYSDPAGNDFITIGKKKCKVALHLSNDHTIIKEKSTSGHINRYTLIKPDGTEINFDKMGNKVPEEIKKVHGMHAINLTGKEEVSLNMSRQLEGPFLLNNTGSEIAKSIGKLINFQAIDYAISEVKGDLQKVTMNNNIIKENREEKKEELAEYDDLDKLKERVDNYKKAKEETEPLIEELKKLSVLDKQIDELNNNIKTVNFKLERLFNIDKLSNQLNSLIGLNQSLIYNIKLDEKIDINIKKIKINKEEINKLKNINDLELKINKAGSISGEVIGLAKLEEQIENNSENIKKYENKIKNLDGIEKLNLKQKKASGLMEGLIKLINLEDKIIENKKSIKKGTAFYNEISKSYDEFKPLIDKVEKNNILLNGLNNILQNGLQNKIKRTKVASRLKNINQQLQSSAKEYGDLLSESGKCPTCFTPLHEDELDRVMSQIVEND